MSLHLLHTALLVPFESLINRTLALDPATRSQLPALDGRMLAIYCTKPEAQLFITVRGESLHLGVINETGADASLHGPLTALLGLLRPQAALTSLYPLGLELRGDAAFVQQLQQLVRSLQIDWEYPLARILGDIPTQALGTGLRQARNFASDSIGRLHEDTLEFLFEESRLLPGAAELEKHYQAVTQLTQALDRLQARIDRLG